MSKFFIDVPILVGDTYIIKGQDANHISKSLRMQKGDKVILCYKGVDYNCEINKLLDEEVKVQIVSSYINQNEPSVKVTLYQGLPKYDKMDFIVQKAVELGVDKIVPVIMHRCVSKPSPQSYEKKLERWQKISQEAAKQSKRGKIPTILPFATFNEALSNINTDNCNILLYEKGGSRLYNIFKSGKSNFNIFAGPEGGLEESEVSAFINAGGSISTLGKRILRTETAPLAALSAIMYHTGNF